MSFPALLCHSRAGGNPENYSHSEFISESTKKDAQNLFSMTLKSLDSRLRGNDILLLLSSHATTPTMACDEAIRATIQYVNDIEKVGK